MIMYRANQLSFCPVNWLVCSVYMEAQHGKFAAINGGSHELYR